MDLRDGDEIREELDRILMEELGRDLGERLFDHALNPRNWGYIEDPDGEATVTGICEDTVRVQFQLSDGRIHQIKFMTNGCGATVACGSMVTELALGKTLAEAMRIKGSDVIEAFGGLPREHTHCADLAANALREAVKDAMEKQRAPWKRLYRPRGNEDLDRR